MASNGSNRALTRPALRFLMVVSPTPLSPRVGARRCAAIVTGPSGRIGDAVMRRFARPST